MKSPAYQAASAAFGLLMAALPAIGSQGPIAVVIAGVAVAAVLAGVVFPQAATLAVVLTVLVIALGDALPVVVAISGFSAAVYLVLQNATAVTVPTVAGAAGFAFVGLVATAFPIQLPWLPLLAPPAALGCYIVVMRPFLGSASRSS